MSLLVAHRDSSLQRIVRQQSEAQRTCEVARTPAHRGSVVEPIRKWSTADNDGWKEARNCFATLYWYLRSDEYVKVADVQLGIDALAIIRAFVDDERIDPRYRDLQLKRMIANIERQRTRRRERGRRKA